MQEALSVIRRKTRVRAQVGVILGSGLSGFGDSLEQVVRLSYREIPGLSVSTAVGHRGELIIGTIGANGHDAVDVAVMSGRFHLYEGYSAQQVASGVRLLHALGVTRLVVTNAAGGINPRFNAGSLVAITDHLNFQGANPLIGPNQDDLGPRFPDMTYAYSPRLRVIAFEAAQQLGFDLQEGVYAAVLGPSYETPAEIRFLRAIGADLVGMSTVMEVIAANHLGIEVLGISCVTNSAAGLSDIRLDHREVLAVGQRMSATLTKLLGKIMPRVQALG
jgi:purine-nucleoside phosphorylase